MIKLKEYKAANGALLLYTGAPQLTMLDTLAEGPGDVWHNSLEQGFKNCFPELIYQTAVFWWFLNDFKNLESGVNWRLNVHGFVVRANVWEAIGGLDTQYESIQMSGLDFGYNLLRNYGGIPLYVKGLFDMPSESITISKRDRYVFFLKNFKKHHSYYMAFRKGVFKFFSEYGTLKKIKEITIPFQPKRTPVRPLDRIIGTPTVSLVIPTMRRQEFTQLLLKDHNKQTYLIKEAIIVDATPEEERDSKYYKQEDFNFKVKVYWQESKGSCRARNEAIAECTGDYIIFADDDVRILPDFVENHIRLLQTYKADACNGLDIMATHMKQDQTDLLERLEQMGEKRWQVGVSHMFSNANSCVKREQVTALMGNDINFDGGYGEDSDFGLRLLQKGVVLLHNPFSPNLHLKPPLGGYRWWGQQAKLVGKKRKAQPWELDNPVKMIRPVPSPTISYGILKHFEGNQIKEWRTKYFFTYLFKGSKKGFLPRLINIPYKQIQFTKSLKYAKALLKLGERF